MTATVQKLRAVPTDPPPRSPERDQLRAAIEQHATAAKRLAKIGDARERAASVNLAAFSAVKRSKAALEEAATGESHHLASVALGEADAAANPVKAAAAALERAEAAYATSKKTEAALAEQADIAEHELAKAKSQLDDAVKAVVLADLATQRLVHDYQTAQSTYLDLCKLMSALGNVGCHPVGSFGEGYAPDYNFVSRGPAPAAPQWLAAISQLRENADAVLPQE